MDMRRLLITLATVVIATTATRAQTGDCDCRLRFAWGADIGSSFDMTGHDMTCFDIDVAAGIRGSWLRFAGVGTGISSMVDNGSSLYPLYALVRTGFTSRPSLLFAEARVGCVFADIRPYPTQTDFYLSLGGGITLASSPTFSSHLTLTYTYLPLQSPRNEPDTRLPDLSYMALRIGCAF